MDRPLYISDLVEPVLAHMSPKSRPTYKPAIMRLAQDHGGDQLAFVRLPQLETIRDSMRREISERKVERARANGRRLMSYDPDAHGHGAAENAVRGLRYFFRYAVNCGYLAVDPALNLKAPKRRPAPERPLTSEELADVWRGALCNSDDPELDELILTTVRHTACRREGTINLSVDHLNFERASILLSEKNGKIRELPLRVDLLERLRGHALSRGAQRPGDAVLRYKDGHPLTRRRFNTIFDRVDRTCGWTEPLDVGAHWIRHTTLADIAAVSGLRVAEKFAGHTDEELGVIGRYTKPTFENLADAYEVVFGARR
ncbi:MAG TPA: tyrosine-type recombinase/integrase [Nocardioides sp.]|uniref:tyrosine-type recombinase/integrase n=1 Tax=uncultured Nocardioides sp. TaxID=198441 RepID=UPI000ED459BD|nr:tyrosine-type recombinase/integrase [uncultured Nocardioides sp.]HCB03186.1 hypothetical protein [Nocardioides sp.]HRD59518.1 tyrosine-type recombinase/integrase [Nocardioides sp.]HRI94995.1 tyrosine-type recombinase/integrase [Nocardioides sp.]HRK44757.1 tyrosine-type recombinase/integrase [Nocardioides sp.]